MAVTPYPRWRRVPDELQWALAIDDEHAVAIIDQEGIIFYASVNSTDPVRRPFRSLDDAMDWCQHMRGVEMSQ